MKIVREQAIRQINTVDFFEGRSTSDELSPIDEFIDAVLRINGVCTDPINMPNELGHLMILGYVSAVESFLRSLIRQVVNADPASRAASQRQTVSFAAATHHEVNVLPEALIERVTFTGSRPIHEALITYLGLKKGHTERAITGFCSEYDKVCQLRHCIVHRFGKFGSQNALALGFRSHQSHLEQTIQVPYSKTQEVADVCDNTVRGINNFCYEEILRRSHEDKWVEWTSDLRKDRAQFSRYYSVFSSQKHTPASLPIKESYNDFRDRVLTQASR